MFDVVCLLCTNCIKPKCRTRKAKGTSFLMNGISFEKKTAKHILVACKE